MCPSLRRCVLVRRCVLLWQEFLQLTGQLRTQKENQSTTRTKDPRHKTGIIKLLIVGNNSLDGFFIPNLF